MNITFSKKSLPKGGTLAVTVFDKGVFGPLGTDLNKRTKGALKAAVKATEFTGKKNQLIQVLAPMGTSIERIILVGLGKAGDLDDLDLQKIGGGLANAYLTKIRTLSLAIDLVDDASLDEAAVASNLAFGATLGAYRFDRYRTKMKPAQKSKLGKIGVLVDDVATARKTYKPMSHLADGVCLARDLSNEPANILTPEDFATRCQALGDLGVKVTVLGEKEMTKLKMGSLLGVSRGSSKEAKMAIMEWNGGKKGDAPVALVGKGLTFDSGGISLKPGGGMEDMKGDMGGAAAVTGVMSVLAARGAKANVVGVVALVENMPDADAQRPGDIVTSMSGQTIEIINTDAEGRLVLADALWHTQETFKPRLMIDLATLTGAILVSLAHVHAGMFTNSDDLAAELKQAGKASGDSVWRMPIGEEYDRLIDSKFADMKNSGARGGGSCTAAQFLQRFTNKVPWCHLDIAGTAFGAPQNSTCKSWGSGYGVRLLDRWVADHVEG